MSLTLEQVRHIANLARLELSQEELSRYQEQLSAILAYFQQLEDLDTTDIPPTASVSDDESRLRADQIQSSLDLIELLRNAPQTAERQFRVPPIFE
jgi:aspartyl-tRNA(Asn)/glutamyl-tRNA(Gln) amidotransferase subunit C